MSKGLQTAMSAEPFNGDPAKLSELHPAKSNFYDPTLAPLPRDLPVPETSPSSSYRAVCSASRGTAQTSDGWHTDLIKDINLVPTEDNPDPLYGIENFL